MKDAAQNPASNAENAPQKTASIMEDAAQMTTSIIEETAHKTASKMEAAPISGSMENTTQQDLSVTGSETQSIKVERRKDDITYMAWANDPTNLDEILETDKFLRATVVDKSRYITFRKPSPSTGRALLWGGLTFDAAALKKAQEYEGIDGVDEEPDVDED